MTEKAEGQEKSEFEQRLEKKRRDYRPVTDFTGTQTPQVLDVPKYAAPKINWSRFFPSPSNSKPNSEPEPEIKPISLEEFRKRKSKPPESI